MADFQKAYIATAGSEGGWCDVPDDRGGETYKGIARNLFPGWSGWTIIDAWKRAHGRPRHNQYLNDPVLDGRVHSFYKYNFWDKVQGDKIKSQEVANELYDMAVNAGLVRAISLMQRQFHMVETGRMDNHLLSKINNRETNS